MSGTLVCECLSKKIEQRYILAIVCQLKKTHACDVVAFIHYWYHFQIVDWHVHNTTSMCVLPCELYTQGLSENRCMVLQCISTYFLQQLYIYLETLVKFCTDVGFSETTIGCLLQLPWCFDAVTKFLEATTKFSNTTIRLYCNSYQVFQSNLAILRCNCRVILVQFSYCQ